MDWLQFLAAVTASIAWPTAAIVIVVLLRRAILNLLPKLRRVKYKELEAEFGEVLHKVEKEVAELPEPIALPQASQDIERSLENIASFSNNSAVFVAWLSVESAILNLARAVGVLETNMPSSEAARLLLDKKLIDQATFRTLKDLQALRNLAVHSGESRIISDAETIRFKKLAEKVTAILEDRARRL